MPLRCRPVVAMVLSANRNFVLCWCIEQASSDRATRVRTTRSTRANSR
jgi:hypothetical protein